ncbi:uncharacterized protein [Henckelia pumila]|uniref:uncharacterized protein isoform X2 n=1 Tax=Henckelia pumila TaxID=405737 RepID=UPI003C6E6E85
MESQMQRPAHQHIEHSGESTQSGEKKSVIKKVKDKAKKIKDTLKKQGQGQGQEHEYRYDENVDEEDDDDDEFANDREIHAHDSTVIRSTNLPMEHDQNVEEQTDTRGDRIDPMLKGEAKARPNIPAQTGYEEENPSENKHFPSPLSVQREGENVGEPETKLGPSLGLEEDPDSTKFGPGDAPSNYGSKVSDPTGDGGKEAGVGSLIHKFDHLNVGDESKAEQKPSAGSHDQFSPQPTPTQDQFNPESDPKSFDSNTKEGMPSDTITGKVSSAVSGRAISAKNMLASKLGYGGGSGQEGLSPSNKPESESTPGYTQRITDTLNPVYEKVTGAGTAVMSKFQTGKQGGDYGQEGISPSNKPASESTLGSGQEGLSPSNKPESESTPGYTQRITDTLNPVYEKVTGAGTAVMSKFQTGKQGGQEGTTSPSNKPASESTPGYTQRITDTLNPVYEKVAGAGTAVMSKFQGSGDAGAAAATGTDKGVSSKDYWAEKLKPGDEDKALSEAITGALHKKKEGYMQKTGEEKPLGKVTESEEVATHLGSGIEGKREGEDAFDAGRESSGPGVVGRVKDAFGSWMGKGTGTQTAQESINETYVDKAGEKPSLPE